MSPILLSQAVALRAAINQELFFAPLRAFAACFCF